MSGTLRGKALTREFLTVLRRYDAPRVMTREMAEEALVRLDPTIGPTVATRFLDAAVDAGMLTRPRKGLYVNGQAQTAVTIGELIPYVRARACVSFYSALSGIIHNPPDRIWAVVPTEWVDKEGKTHRSTIGRVTWPESGMEFEIRAISGDVLMAPDPDDLYATGVAGERRATPEAALCHILYLSKNNDAWGRIYSEVRTPNGSSGRWATLMNDRASRIAKAMDLSSELDAFFGQIGDPTNGKFGDDPEPNDEDGPELVF